MSVAFAPHRQRGKGDITPAGIQKLLDENNQLIQCIMDFQSKGKTAECSQYQQMLHRNLVYLATIADSNQNMQSLLPAKCDSPTPPEVKFEPPTQNMPMGPGGMNQTGAPGPQPPHGHTMPSEAMVSGGPPAPHMQNQMNGQMPGPNHMPMQGPGPGPNQPPNMPGSGSMNMPPSSHGSMGGYNHAVPSSQGIPAQGQINMTQGQGPMGNYGPRPNMNMQPNQGPMMHQQPPSQQYNMAPGAAGQHYQGQQNPMGMMGQVNQGNHVMGQRPMPPYRPPQQGPPQQYPGQEDYYGDQYSHAGQGASEGDSGYGLLHPPYPDQGFDSSPQYYQGERDPAANQQSPYEKDHGNAQYGQQQEAYQQGPPQQQGYPPQQQYPGQQGYPGQQQGYGPSQGAPGQYPQGYPQGQGQQYGAYRGPQPGPPQAQQQRPYPGYDQGHMRK
ncbi:protein SSXT isoform X3 [Esox lucius]|uniref:protein SSXT isoform X3 n=1 Tax=Esox lucius TaxID=8010 RepID=UPI00147738A3|nr:protein SSXT isoform X3 [Esox lucius]